ncbi:MAG: YitT family protein [Lachnospiraceae bacterium]|nr:YitT family protein [Lachnospiraceae bacterium]
MSEKKNNREEYVEKKSIRRQIFEYICITAASFVYAVGVALFIDPSNLAPGGLTGIAIIVSRLTGVETGTLIFILNIPIVLIGFWKFGWKFMVSTFYCVIATSVFTNLLAPYGAATNDILLSAIAGGALVAASIGFVFKCGATTGGTDIIVKLLRRRFPHLRTGALFMLTDAIIVTVSVFVFRDLNAGLYAAITVVVTSVVMDFVLYGRDEAKMIYIISDHSENITARLLEELNIGVTHIEGTGAYSGKEKKVIFCVMRKTLAPRAEQIVREEDADAFMIVSNATEIFGEGYKSYFSEKL